MHMGGSPPLDVCSDRVRTQQHTAKMQRFSSNTWQNGAQKCVNYVSFCKNCVTIIYRKTSKFALASSESNLVDNCMEKEIYQNK